MKSRNVIALTAAFIFLLSHLLPAYQELRGYECVLQIIENSLHPYYHAFIFTNALFLGLVIASF